MGEADIKDEIKGQSVPCVQKSLAVPRKSFVFTLFFIPYPLCLLKLFVKGSFNFPSSPYTPAAVALLFLCVPASRLYYLLSPESGLLNRGLWEGVIKGHIPHQSDRVTHQDRADPEASADVDTSQLMGQKYNIGSVSSSHSLDVSDL